MSQIVAIQAEDRILLVQQSAVQGPPGPAGASGSGVAVSGGTGTVTSVGLIVPSGLVVSGSPITSSGAFTVTYASGVQAYRTAESSKLATIASGAQINVGTNLSYSGASRVLNSSTGSGVILPLFADSEAGLVGGSGGGTINFLRADGQWAAPPAGSGTSSGTSGGTVTSVGLVVPSGFSVSGSPVTTSGNVSFIFASGFSLPTLASQDSWNTAFNERLYWDGGPAGLNAASGRTSLGLTALATATPSGGLSIEGGNLVPGEIVKLIVSDVGQTGIATGNSKSETRLDRPFAVVGVWWNCHPTAMGSGGTSDARPYIRTSAGTTSTGTKINLLTTSGNIASLAASVHTVNATSSISGGTYSGATGDWLGVDLQSLGAGSSGHQLTYILRYS